VDACDQDRSQSLPAFITLRHPSSLMKQNFLLAQKLGKVLKKMPVFYLAAVAASVVAMIVGRLLRP
jgi:hypothetical protein